MLLLPLLAPLAHAEARQPTHSYTLNNGLQVIIREDHRAPVVVSQVWYKVGGVDERRHVDRCAALLSKLIGERTQVNGVEVEINHSALRLERHGE